MKRLLLILMTAAAITASYTQAFSQATILPPGVTCFSTVPLGSIGFYIPNTLSFKQTWQDAGETILNQNPVPLDANGCAIIYGAGIYRMIVKDSLGNTAYDQLTASTGPNGLFWAGTAGGTGNAITVTDSSFALQDGATIQFRAFAPNIGSTTVAVSSGTPAIVVKDTSSGPAPLTGGEIGQGNAPIVTYDAPNAEFHLVNPSVGGSQSAAAGLLTPQGYLNLVGQASGGVIQTGDVIGATTIYYSPFVGDTVPIWNGTTFVSTVFSELTAALTAAASPSNTIQDACVFSNNGIPTLVIGPSWANVSAGSGSRGTGLGTAQLSKLQGIWVNATQIIGFNGLSSYTIPANQCTYVGSLSIDATAGQISAYLSYGQNRKWGVWNAYNRQLITLIAGDSASTWIYNTNTIRPSNNSSANGLVAFTGLPEEAVNITFTQLAKLIAPNGGAGGEMQNGIGYNSTTAFSGQSGDFLFHNQTTATGEQGNAVMWAHYVAPPALGLNTVTALETSP